MKKSLKLKWKIIFGIILVIILSLLCMRFIGTSGLIVREYKIANSKLPHSFYGLKIVHFTDLHYGMSVDDKKLKELVKKINLVKPDIVIFTGDLVDRNTDVTEEVVKSLVDNLSDIKSVYGKYYVKGNHDLVNASYDSIMSKVNFTCLDDATDVIYSKDNKSIFIGGVSVNKTISASTVEEINLNNYDYKIFALHYPDEVDSISKYNFDLILSGHSHNGQVRLPVLGAIVKPHDAKKYYDEYYKINNTDLYISGGIGNSTLNLRLFNTPSFNLYRLVDK